MQEPDGTVDASIESSYAPATRRERRTSETMAPSRRPVLLWAGAIAATLLTFAGLVTVLNATLYSPSGFVERYLQAIDRRDLATLLETPGVSVPEGSDASSLVREGLVAVDEARVIQQFSTADGRRAVDVTWTDDQLSGRVRYLLEPQPSIAGIFSSWRFARSPISVMPVTALHSPEIRANGVAIRSADPAAITAELRVAAFVPSRLVLDHESRYLDAAPVTVVAGGSTAPVIVDVQANDTFVSTVQQELDKFLDECATQQVLLPAGCPFGRLVEDRLLGPPEWSMVEHPVVTLVPGNAVNEWIVPSTPGVAHIRATVISLFDGSQSTLDEDVPFGVSYRIEIDSSESLRILGADAPR